MGYQSGLTRFSFAFTLVWAIMHFVTAFTAPWISLGTSPLILSIVYIVLGISLIFALVWVTDYKDTYWELAGRIILFVNAVLQIWSCINTFTGQQLLNIPFPNLEVFQVAMSFLEFASAVFMLALVFDEL